MDNHNVNAVIIKKEALNCEILFQKASDYIKTSLKASNIQNIYEVRNLSEVTDEMLTSDYLIVINEVAPEIVEYDQLIERIVLTDAEISFFALLGHELPHHHHHEHDHDCGCDHDHEHEHDEECDCEEEIPSTTSIDIFILSCETFKTRNIRDLKQDNVIIPDVTIVESYVDAVALNEEFKYQVNNHLLKQGVYIIDPNNTYIMPGVQIGARTTVLPNTIIKGATVIGQNCTIGPSAFIESSKIGDNTKINNSQVFESKIGNNTSVGPFAYVRPLSDIGNDVKIGDFVEVKKSTIGDGTKVSHLTYIGDATVGKKVNFGCGTVVVNYDGFNKYQTVIEDNAFIGCNTNLVSPVTVKKGAITAAGSTITKDVPENDLAISRVKQENKPLWADKFRKLKSKK